ncbi:MAG: serine/threonine protein kinase [bacterium]|nr:serine/threonine protein kinase [bacterium]
MLFICTNCKNEINSLNKPDFCSKCKNSSFTNEDLLVLAPKMKIADFKLIKKIGKGGMGEVWLAEQTSSSKLVALKILYPSFNHDSEFKKRFLNEVNNSLKLDHPSIVKTIDTGSYKGVYYLASEFIKGKILQQKLNEEKVISEKQSLLIGLSTAKALLYAWNNFKILHRDIKPSNLIIDIKGLVTILDLGVAKNLTEDITITIDGEVVGTPFYMSPEQSKSEGVDCRADIYSLGATLYHILTGTVPYEGTSPMAILAKHITDDLVPPIDINSSISEATSELIERMMAKHKAQRYQTWEDVINAIEIILSGHTSVSHIKTRTKSFFKRKNKNLLPSDELQANNKKLKNSSSSYHLNLKTQDIESDNEINKHYIPPSIYDYDEDTSILNKKKKIKLTGKLTLISSLSLIVIILFIFTYFLGYIKIEEQFNFYFIAHFKNFLNQFSHGVLAFISDHTSLEKNYIEFSINVYNFCLGIVAVLIFMLSAFWSAEIAEKHRKNRLTAFILGAIFPIIVPLFSYKLFNIQKKKIMAHDIGETHNIEEPTEINYKQQLFKELIYNDEGKPSGPFKFELFDDSSLYVSEILEVQNKLLVLKTENPDGSKNKIRLPYKKIKTFNKI